MKNKTSLKKRSPYEAPQFVTKDVHIHENILAGSDGTVTGDTLDMDGFYW